MQERQIWTYIKEKKYTDFLFTEVFSSSYFSLYFDHL